MAEHPNTFHLVIASVGQTRFDGAALSATLPGTAGEMTILPHHEPLVTTLRKGTITVRESLGEKTFDIESGVLEISNNRAVVLL
jgi:F-type H+-transporting ATPase subunit epsilon